MTKLIRGTDVTVVVPTIEGREHLLERALASVTKQQVPPARVVVQLDTERHGAAWCRNEALTHVKTDWVAWLDDDDQLLENHIKVLVRGANKSGADMVFSYGEFVKDNGDGTTSPAFDPLACVDDAGNWHMSPINIPFGPVQKNALRWFGNFIPITYMVKTELIRNVGGFPEPYAFEARQSRDCEDYGLLLRMLDAGAEFHHITGIRTWRYFFHDSNLGGRGTNRMDELRGIQK
jgi:glycosyltransferase involved in cell wall biosynthesis